MGIMECFLIILVLIVIIRAVNERFIHMQGDIALVLFSSVISVGLLIAKNLAGECAFTDFVNEIGNFGFSEYLLDGVLCFMLFAGAGKVNFRKFKSNIKTISLLALITTVISSALYGLIFWAAGFVFGIKLDIWLCILLGCIVSPTDPIAATGILNKLGLSKNVTSVIESESLFNDGTGVALFLFVKSIVSRSGEENFLFVMLKEVLGALGVALVVSFLLFKLITLTKSPVTRIIISLLDVSLSYFVCEKFGFSGIIASVVCGMYFSYMTAKKSDSIIITDTEGVYRSFWDAAEEILNSVLFVMIGLSLLSAKPSEYIWFIIPASIIIGLVSRFAGVMTAGAITGKRKIPGNYSLTEYAALMTWTGLKGGLSLALAMSTAAFLGETEYLLAVNLAYATIFFTTIVQGLATKPIYRRIERKKALRIRKESELTK